MLCLQEKMDRSGRAHALAGAWETVARLGQQILECHHGLFNRAQRPQSYLPKRYIIEPIEEI